LSNLFAIITGTLPFQSENSKKHAKELFTDYDAIYPGTASNAVGLRKYSSQNGLIIRRT